MKKLDEHHRKAKRALEEAHRHLKKYHETLKDRRHESEGMKAKEDRSAAQKRAMRGKSKAKRDEIKGGEKANIRLRRERKYGHKK